MSKNWASYGPKNYYLEKYTLFAVYERFLEQNKVYNLEIVAVKKPTILKNYTLFFVQ